MRRRCNTSVTRMGSGADGDAVPEREAEERLPRESRDALEQLGVRATSAHAAEDTLLLYSGGTDGLRAAVDGALAHARARNALVQGAWASVREREGSPEAAQATFALRCKSAIASSLAASLRLQHPGVFALCDALYSSAVVAAQDHPDGFEVFDELLNRIRSDLISPPPQ